MAVVRLDVDADGSRRAAANVPAYPGPQGEPLERALEVRPLMNKKNKGGRPRLNIDPGAVEKLAAIHCTIPEIAAVLGCSPRTIRGRFFPVLKEGRCKGRMSLRRVQYQMAQDGNATMAIWLGKQLLKQTDKAAVEHTGTDGGPIKTETTLKIQTDLEQCASEFERFVQQRERSDRMGQEILPPNRN